MKKKSPSRNPSLRPKINKSGCVFCKSKTTPDYKNFAELSRFVSDRGRIANRARSGVCAKHQRRLAVAIKRARHLALLPFKPAI